MGQCLVQISRGIDLTECCNPLQDIPEAHARLPRVAALLANLARKYWLNNFPPMGSRHLSVFVDWFFLYFRASMFACKAIRVPVLLNRF
jgi:hypothetical protein